MKKIIVPIIIAAALGVGGGITAVMLNRSNVADAETPEPVHEVPELKTGKYYLNGDKSSGLWIEVNPEFLTLKGDDVDASLRKAINDDAVENENVEAEFSNAKELYCTEKIYSVSYFGTENVPYIINVSRHNTVSTPEELKNSNAGFPYNADTNTIKLALLGHFTLVE